MTGQEGTPLRYGWTTGACATAATTAAYTALLTGEFPDPVEIVLPKGHRPSFALARERLDGAETGSGGTSGPRTGPGAAATPGSGSAFRSGFGSATAGIVKDAGDDPDVTHGALVSATVRRGQPDSGVVFRAGGGVGTITKPGLPLPVGEPAINPVPRRLMREAVERLAAEHGDSGDVELEISVEEGEELARHTWNPRLGILGGLSVLGTTGVVVPYSCSAWIDSIRRGVDVARAEGLTHVAGCTGSTSEKLVTDTYGLAPEALLDMGDFAGAVLKYLRRHPIPRLTIAGGIGKLAKLADGHLDLHSKRSQVNFALLSSMARDAGATGELAHRIRNANTALEALTLCREAGLPLGDLVAAKSRAVALETLRAAPVEVEILVINRAGDLVGRADFA